LSSPALELDDYGAASLDGVWSFYPGDSPLAALDSRRPERINVPGLWEAQGWTDLDGAAWYRREVRLTDVGGWWSLRFAAVMDFAEVWLNGVHLGDHDNGFTPFVLDPGPALLPGANDLAVRVVDPPVGDPQLLRSAHGKQGWANHVFPSRPSLYLTYGGIWQPVTLRRHGPIVVDDLFFNGDPDRLVARVTITNRSARRCRAAVTVRAVGVVRTVELETEPSTTASGALELGPTRAARWGPDDPVLHHGTVDVSVDGVLSDSAAQRFGVRTVRREGSQIFVNDTPYRMKSALVQGFRAVELYGAGTRAHIESEVRAAREMGFNTLRLHIKAFEPAYLDVCDESGMLLHCDIR
jgi:beta-galactosidase/beta-glucuronidase